MSPLMLKLRIFLQNWGSNMHRLTEDDIPLDEQMILGIEVMVSIETEPQINADERRLITSAHRKVSYGLMSIDDNEKSFIPDRKEVK